MSANQYFELRCKGTTILQNMQEKVLKICKFTMNYKQGLFFSANSQTFNMSSIKVFENWIELSTNQQKITTNQEGTEKVPQ